MRGTPFRYPVKVHMDVSEASSSAWPRTTYYWSVCNEATRWKGLSWKQQKRIYKVTSRAFCHRECFRKRYNMEDSGSDIEPTD